MQNLTNKPRVVLKKKGKEAQNGVTYAKPHVINQDLGTVLAVLEMES